MIPKGFKTEDLERLPDDPEHAIAVLSNAFQGWVHSIGASIDPEHDTVTFLHGSSPADHFEAATYISSVFAAFTEIHNFDFRPTEATGSAYAFTNSVLVNLHVCTSNWLAAYHRRSLAEAIQRNTEHTKSILLNRTIYRFEEQQLNRIQVLVNELRNLINESKLLEPGHKSRLLRRLEALQAEIHATTTGFDKFWSFVGQAGIAIEKFGKNLEPITQRVRELTRIVITVIAFTEGLPALPKISELLLLDDSKPNFPSEIKSQTSNEPRLDREAP